MSNSTEIKIGKLYIGKSLKFIIIPIDKFIDTRTNQCMIEYSFIDRPDESLTRKESQVISGYEEL